MAPFKCMGEEEFQKYLVTQFDTVKKKKGRLRSLELLSPPVKVSKPDFESPQYKFDYPYRGLAVIFNNIHFENEENRLGSEVDAVNLSMQFEALGFDVIEFRDLSKTQMEMAAEKASEKYKHEDADCFVCVVLSHGTHGDKKTDHMIFGSDGKELETQYITNLFNDDHCKGLINKPRLFFIQACRGDAEDVGASKGSAQTKNENPSPKKEKRDIVPETRDMPIRDTPGSDAHAPIPGGVGGLGLIRKKPMEQPVVHSVPLYQDCLMMYASPPGYMALKVENGGSYFIEELCNKLQNWNGIKDVSLLRVLTSVCAAVAQRPESIYGTKRMPVIETMLTKDIFMIKKE